MTANWLFAVFFAGSICYAAYSDVCGLLIPNAISLMLAAVFPVYALLFAADIHVLSHVILAVGAFAVLYASFHLNLMGGGDVKLMTAILLWTGPPLALRFLLVMALWGGLFALILLILQKVLRAHPNLEPNFPVPVAAAWARRGILPYGLPIAAGALTVTPVLFSL